MQSPSSVGEHASGSFEGDQNLSGTIQEPDPSFSGPVGQARLLTWSGLPPWAPESETDDSDK